MILQRILARDAADQKSIVLYAELCAHLPSVSRIGMPSRQVVAIGRHQHAIGTIAPAYVYLGSLMCAGYDHPRHPGREPGAHPRDRSEEHTSELQSLMRISYAALCLK